MEGYENSPGSVSSLCIILKSRPLILHARLRGDLPSIVWLYTNKIFLFFKFNASIPELGLGISIGLADVQDSPLLYESAILMRPICKVDLQYMRKWLDVYKRQP